MIAVRSVDSFKYATRLFAYLFVVLLVGGGLVGLGGSIGYSDVRNLIGSGTYSTSELAGGVVLATLGVFVLLTGLFGILYKLIGDAVATGAAHAVETETATASASSIQEADSSQAQEASTSQAEESQTSGGTSAVAGEEQTEPTREQTEPTTERTEPQRTPDAEPEPADHGTADAAVAADSNAPSTEPAQTGATRSDPVADDDAGKTNDRTEQSAVSADTGTDSRRDDSVTSHSGDMADAGRVDESPTDKQHTTDTAKPEEDSWESATRTSEGATDKQDSSTGASEATTSESGAEPTMGAPPDSSVSDGEETGLQGESESPPEPSPEEIAFGSTGDEEGSAEESDDESVPDEQAGTGSVEPAGDPSAGDPLADPTDDE